MKADSYRGYNLAPSASAKDDTPRGAARIFNAMKVQAAFRASGRKTSEDTGDRYAERMRLKAEKDKAKAKEKEDKGGKRKAEDDAAAAAAAKKTKTKKTELPKIGEHETLAEYNRRIESLLRGGVASAIKAAESARGQQIQAAKEAKAERIAIAQGKKPLPKTNKVESEDEDEEEAQIKPNRPERTFAELPQRKRLNDIVQAPPQLPRMRQAKKATGADAPGSAWSATGRVPLSAAQKRILEEERERVVGLYREMKAKKEAEKQAERDEKAKGKGGKKAAPKESM